LSVAVRDSFESLFTPGLGLALDGGRLRAVGDTSPLTGRAVPVALIVGLDDSGVGDGAGFLDAGALDAMVVIIEVKV
jgi:hypothetical protein